MVHAVDLFGLFGHTGAVTWAQECARAVVVFLFGLAAVRLAGRRIFARWSAPDIVVSIIAGSSLSRALTGNAPLWATLAATALLIALHWLTAQGAARSALVSRIVEGRSIELGRGGSTDEGLLRHHSLSETDLQEALRQAGVETPAKTRLVVLEPSGKISILKSQPTSPLEMRA